MKKDIAMERFPAFCAHRGVSALLPENSMPSFAAAIALGADEMELDVWLTKDRKLVVSHDCTLDRISDGTGKVSEYTLSELKKRNIGIKCGWRVPFCSADEVLEQFANRVIMNIHLKETGENGEVVKQLTTLARRYNALDSIYFAGCEQQLSDMLQYAPEIPRTAIQLPETTNIYEIARRYQCSRVQFWLGMFDEELIHQFHREGILCNLFYADTAEEMQKYEAMGIDVILTNRMDIAAWKRAAEML